MLESGLCLKQGTNATSALLTDARKDALTFTVQEYRPFAFKTNAPTASPVKLGRLDVAQAVWVGAGEQQDVSLGEEHHNKAIGS